ncbi:uncharacterized protein MELLADRAFT_84253 [Melampsora larici-populina 98AG31]|uniref:Uncharacterized protein n=1 Tax=Melampsora larici-populina (strain 98AG31 / pathotype 3-4-7) TaxID=747676 RepID=F4RF22_MELLP|nr:uncharacterized protein MELLADRAFT_84253 [Melampsora larici-populina 98AG31]EGG09013.1 hypothetical protein MELLADRAFT_84253 [Melampsora larici-populina 98AG31]
MSWLYPITHKISWFIRTPAIALLGPECYTHLIYDLQPGSGIVKIPQIFKILKSKSARGLSLSSFILDTLGLIIIVGYNYRHDFPILTYE